MKKYYLSFILFLLTGLAFFSSPTFATPLPAQKVFHSEVKLTDPNAFNIHWAIRPGYFLYMERIQLSLDENPIADLGSVKLPPALIKKDRLGQTYPIYRAELTVPVPILGKKSGQTVLSLNFQGCSDQGFCYPPEKRQIQINIDKALALSAVELVETDIANTPPNHFEATDSFNTIFNTHHWWAILGIFFGLGLLLSFTPCVLPMVPVLSGIILGHHTLSTQKAFALSCTYVVSMAATYALIGLSVALIGENLQIMMQSPAAISLVTGIFVLLALSMFGLFDLKLPQSWQKKLADATLAQARGHYISTAIMGCLSTLVLSPCVTAPLVGALGYIAQTGDLLLGASTLFAMGLGMGVPLLLIGTSAGKYLPKTGRWMNAVKSFFAFLLLAMAIQLFSRLAPAPLIMGCWAILVITAGIYVGAFSRENDNHSDKFKHRAKLKQSLGIGLLLYGLMILIGAAMGHTNPLQPLSSNTTLLNPSKNRVTSLSELNQQLSQAKGKPVLLDFYADWCVACQIMETTSFQDPMLKKALEAWVVIQVDITDNKAPQRELLQKYHVIAPPSFIFLNATGKEHPQSRLVGEISTQDFIEHLKKQIAKKPGY